MVFAFLAWRDAGWRRGWMAALCALMTLVLLSTSVTAPPGMVLGFFVPGAAWWMVKGRYAAAVLLRAVAVAVSALTIVHVVAPGLLLRVIGKNAILAGRTNIWEELTGNIQAKAWLGYGYQAFGSKDSEPQCWFRQAVDWAGPSGHDGWLDLAVSPGPVRPVLFLLDYPLSIWRALDHAPRRPAGVIALAMLMQFMLLSMSESILLCQNPIIWATYCFVSARLALDAGQQRACSSAPVLIPGTAVRAGG